MFRALCSPISAAPPIAKPLFSSSSSSSSSSSHPPSNGRNSKASVPDLPPASRIFVRNLSHSTGEATLIKLFSKYGQLVEVKLSKHAKTNRSKGYAFIQYSCQDDAVLAIEQMDHKMIGGRVVYAEIAKPLNAGFAAYPRGSGPPLQLGSDVDPEGDVLQK